MSLDVNYTRETATGIPRAHIFFASFTATI